MDKPGGASKAASLLRGLMLDCLHDVDVTRRLLPRVPDAVFVRITWDQVISMARNLAGEATVVGKLWTGNVAPVEELAGNVQQLFGLLQRLIMLSYGSILWSGDTLGARRRMSVSRLVDVATSLIKEAVFTYGSQKAIDGDVISQLIAAVWESFVALKDTPYSNVSVIGEALRKATAPIREHLRVMKEVIEQQQAASTSCDEDKASAEAAISLINLELRLSDPLEMISRELEKARDEASVDHGSELKDKASPDETSALKELQKGSVEGEAPVHDGYAVKDSGDEGSTPKEMEKGSAKDEASMDDGSAVKDEASVDDGSAVKDEASVDDGSAVKDENSGNERSNPKEMEKGSVKDEASIEDGSAVKDEDSGDEGSNPKEMEKASVKDDASVDDGSAVIDEASNDDVGDLLLKGMTAPQLTTNAITGVLDMLDQLSPAVIGLKNGENKGDVASFVESLENIAHVGFSLIKAAVSSYGTDSEREGSLDAIPKLTSAVRESLDMTASNNVAEIAEALSQVALSMKENLREMEEKPEVSTEVKEEVSIEEKAMVSTEVKEEVSIEEKPEASTEVKEEVSIEEKAEPSTDEKAVASTEEKAEPSTEEKAEPSIEEKAEPSSGEPEKTSDASIKEAEDEGSDESGSEWPSDDGDLTPEELATAQIATHTVSKILEMMDLLSRAVAGLEFREKEDPVENFVRHLEKILELGVVIESHLAEFRMCVFHPQDMFALRAAFKHVWKAMSDISTALYKVSQGLNYPPEFTQAWADSVQAMRNLDKELDRRDEDA